MKLFERSAADLARAVREGKFSVSEVVEAHLSRLERMEPALSALVTPMREEARSRSAALDIALDRGEKTGPLTGVPVIVKDNFCTRGVRTTCSSRMLEQWVPPYDASVVRYLEEAGAILIGKANMDEFAMGSSTEHSAFFTTSNPWDPQRVPGGSSGGSAAACAAGYAPLTFGSDTGGSIRQPAAFCGVYGFKPTYGMVSRYGLVPFACSLDQIGPFSRSLEDLLLAMEVVARPDERDGTCSRRPRPAFLSALETESLKGKKIGLVKEFSAYEIDGAIDATLKDVADLLRSAGAEIVDVSLPTMKHALACYYIIAPAEASSNLARFDGVRYGLSAQAEGLLELYFRTRRLGFGPEVKRRLLTGTYVLSSGYYDAYYNRALKVVSILKDEFERAFSEVDLLLTPTTPTLPFRKGENMGDPIKMYMSDLFTLPANMAGLPALSLNGGYSGGLPVGVQLMGPRFGEMEIFGAAAVIEKRLGLPRIAGGDL
ncbi:Asp-tRNA(Asn)/Glu-tRNA(Gln) amidotransferase subunit GatA [Aminithiophilus ramosus]|uniref:Glutamyl-tRNA(Gln) amidotransferase subunit A n=1 Tax=Aminithiophilus ramosus TaxID=3029084 RepID=A0A9Q7EZJ6_9BACT|nr:Asp-tRNA(Asn)/Glu-tRNA(Gln) amidotransferase subunit GatA [Aminithiophilus ramosus]QTX33071.1 Asp-tRNA(Asn)/Glu-tRNA(Gln) amidotransferase subunit GatA [Aminithiophilus ramosus]